MQSFHIAAISILVFLALTEFCSSQVKQQDVAAPKPARTAQCFLQINGVYYLGGNCLFTPLDTKGSFRITADKGLAVEVTVKADQEGDASWSGTQNEAVTMPIGAVVGDGRGCWEDKGIPAKTYVCAWDKRQRLYLGPTPQESKWTLAWGERSGMNARIISRSGLDTEQAVVIAEKDRDSAVIECRGNHDYSLKCIDQMIGTPHTKTILKGNCKTKVYSDFMGRKLQYLDSDILDLESGELLGYSSAAGSTIANSAFEALCPKTVEVGDEWNEVYKKAENDMLNKNLSMSESSKAYALIEKIDDLRRQKVQKIQQDYKASQADIKN